jgi:hypothetical protein
MMSIYVINSKHTSTNLRARACQILTEHHDPRSLVRELRALEAFLEQLEVSTTAIAALLEFGLILNDEWLALGVEGSSKGCRNRVMAGL